MGYGRVGQLRGRKRIRGDNLALLNHRDRAYIFFASAMGKELYHPIVSMLWGQIGPQDLRRSQRWRM